MDIKNVVLRVLNFHTEDIDDSLDQDERRAVFIQNPFLKGIYLLLFNVSMYLIAFFVAYFTLTGQLEHINLFCFFNKYKHLMHAILGLLLTLSVKGLRDYVIPKVHDPSKRKWLHILLDVTRFCNFSTLYLLFVWVLVGKSTKPQLSHSKYMLFLMLMLFIARKLIFWLLFLFKSQEKASQVFAKAEPRLQEEVDLHKKIKEMNRLLTRLQKVKEELIQKEHLLQEKKNQAQKTQ